MNPLQDTYVALPISGIINVQDEAVAHGIKYDGFDVDAFLSCCNPGSPTIPPWRLIYGHPKHEGDVRPTTVKPNSSQARKRADDNSESHGFGIAFKNDTVSKSEKNAVTGLKHSGLPTRLETSPTRLISSGDNDSTELINQEVSGAEKQSESLPARAITNNISKGDSAVIEHGEEDRESDQGDREIVWVDRENDEEEEAPLEQDAERMAILLDRLDPRLREYSSILPHHIFHGAKIRRSTGNSESVYGKVLSFTFLANIATKRSGGWHSSSAELGSTTLEFVEGEGGKVLVLKRHNPVIMSRDGGVQMETEREVYARIATVSEEEPGAQFLMWLEAAVTFTDMLGISERALVMPAMPTTLGDVLDRRYKTSTEISKGDIRRIMAQCAIGIATLHSIGVIHADIKPDNIFLDARRNVRIGDFGLSCIAKKVGPLKATVAYGRKYGGTEGYMAPESVEDPPRFSYQVDYWALGLIFWEMVVGNYDFLEALSSDNVEGWAYFHRERKKRFAYFKKYFPVEECDLELELQLVCGLVDPCPQTRMGIDRLLVHRYFEVDGVSEFKDMREKGKLVIKL
ncbi:putative cell cycle serine/threonine-protein kinase CDC5-like protein [Psilocybe cubensis]|uniref:Protein kinase domain-containing protein n=2 Tax=Psilocybe cubensis TaxID=181762 RepID=A0A8H7XWP9_PSICU|nr:putative cell cycle serine/threonine-protein kinase CDC5-like protein [Psilocybe cubensis]KAH9476094.1 putative cell cycle serine/threonine-protein kinase CDC5-like protein [Psilocybe cubensis]